MQTRDRAIKHGDMEKTDIATFKKWLQF